jgi:hypothetical protein
VHLSIVTDEFGRLICELSDGETAAVVTASDAIYAGRELAAALETVQKNGFSECYWHEVGGDYRWVLRREGENVLIAVLWSTGTATGWEHVFFGHCLVSHFAGEVNRELDRVVA